MRATVTLAPDVVSELEKLRRERGLGLSEALNELARRGMSDASTARSFVQTTHAMGMKVDVARTRDVLDVVDADSLHS